MFYGKKASQNPWESNTLEWTTPVEHLHGNWPGEIPTVHRWPYDYSKPGHDQDFIPQTTPFSETMSSNLPHDFEGNVEAEQIQEKWVKENKKPAARQKA
jgi:cytochrome c oxidase subunit 1